MGNPDSRSNTRRYREEEAKMEMMEAKMEAKMEKMEAKMVEILTMT